MNKINDRMVVSDKKSKKLQYRTNKKCDKIVACEDTGVIRKIFDFIAFFGNLMGWKCSYDWTWKNNLRHWFLFAIFIFTWSQIFYSQFKHFTNGEYKRIIEVFALYGISISVIENYLK